MAFDHRRPPFSSNYAICRFSSIKWPSARRSLKQRSRQRQPPSPVKPPCNVLAATSALFISTVNIVTRPAFRGLHQQGLRAGRTAVDGSLQSRMITKAQATSGFASVVKSSRLVNTRRQSVWGQGTFEPAHHCCQRQGPTKWIARPRYCRDGNTMAVATRQGVMGTRRSPIIDDSQSIIALSRRFCSLRKPPQVII